MHKLFVFQLLLYVWYGFRQWSLLQYFCFIFSTQYWPSPLSELFCVCLLVVLNILYKLTVVIWTSCIVIGLGLWIQDSPDHLLLGLSCTERQKTGIEGPKPKANSTDLSGNWWQTKFFRWLKRMDWFSWSLLMCGSSLWGKFVCYFSLFSFCTPA